MHYYQFHIGDYRAATAHLSNDEDLAYRRLLDMYYDTEDPIPIDTDWVARRLRLNSQVIISVLQDMFVLSDLGWHHARCDKEISVYKGFSDAGKRGAAKRWGKAGDSPPITPPIATINQEPITNNHKTNKEIQATIVATPHGVSSSVWNDFVKHRKTLKAQISMTAISRIEQEAAKAGWTLEQALTECVAQGWRGFKADWVTGKQTATQKAAANMNLLTRGMSGPKPAPFWAKPDNNTLEVVNAEPKRLV
jgi:uncharacterized protein YdaU (DUF1376 family)